MGDDSEGRGHEGARTFTSFDGVSPATARALETAGFTTASPVQEATIPLLLSHKDVAVEAW